MEALPLSVVVSDVRLSRLLPRYTVARVASMATAACA
jgi:hypothetical protein